VHARFGVTGDGRTGLVELAEASGLALVDPARRDPTRTTSRGTGELIAAAWDRGCSTVIVCLGGSATVDAGTGIVQALGGQFVDRDGRTIETPLTGADLDTIGGFRPGPAARAGRLRIACDVTNPLLGDTGAAACYGPQKGATLPQVEALEVQLTRLAALLGGDPGQAGAGAAGGAGWGLATMLGAVLEPGIDLVLDAVGFESRCAAADLVLTGEGRLDASSRHGKACAGVARVARGLGVPVVAVVGAVAPGENFDDLFDGVISLSERYGVERAMAEPEALLAEVAGELIADRC
jgi:glycerate kinase